MEDVTVEDAAAFLARFKKGAIATFEATRFAGGRKNHNRIEINGEKGTLVFAFEDMNYLLKQTPAKQKKDQITQRNNSRLLERVELNNIYPTKM